MPDIKDVARLAGVSIATVSRVVADKPHVNHDTREKVLAAITELGYRPSRVARSLRAKSSQKIGLLISDIQNPFFTSLVRAVEDLAYINGYALLLCNTDEDKEKEELYIDLMLAEKVAGVIFIPTQEHDSVCKRLLESNIPVVSVDRRIDDISIDTVISDNFSATKKLIDHLFEDGHRSIGAILAPLKTTTGRERYEGYAASLKAHGIEVDPLYVRHGLPKEIFGFQSANQLLDLPDPPSVIFAGNNLIALGAYCAIRQRRLRIPEDVGLVAFDDMDWATLVEPAITVVPQPSYEMGRAAVELLLRRIKNPATATQEIVFKPELCIRSSCAVHEKE